MKNTIKYNGKLNAIGSKIKDCRIKNKMTQKELAEKLQLYGIDLNKNSLQKLERGDRIIKEYELAVFCEVLNVSADELLKDCTKNLLK
mgnify:FL=1